jgi:hypothetical protein
MSPSGAELARKSGVLFIGASWGWDGNSVRLDCVERIRVALRGLFGSIQLWDSSEHSITGVCFLSGQSGGKLS